MTQNSLIPPPRRIPFNSLDSINYTGAVSFPFLSATTPPSRPLPHLLHPLPRSSRPPGPIPAALCRPVEQPCLNPSDRDHPRVVSRDTGVYQGKPLSSQVKVTGNGYYPGSAILCRIGEFRRPMRLFRRRLDREGRRLTWNKKYIISIINFVQIVSIN